MPPLIRSMMSRLLLAFALLVALSPRIARSQSFIGPVKTTVYQGCFETSACFSLSVREGLIPTVNPGTAFETNLGYQLILTSTYYEPGVTQPRFLYCCGFNSPDPYPGFYYDEDFGFALSCFSVFVQTCVGTRVEQIVPSGGNGAIPYLASTGHPMFTSIDVFIVDPNDRSYPPRIVKQGNVHLQLVPEPSSYALMMMGLAAVGVAARKRRRS